VKKILLVIVLAAAIVFVVIGCRKKDKTADKYRIAVIPKGTTHVFWKSIHAGAVKAERELQASGVKVIWKGPLKEDDRESQIRVVEDFVTRGVSAIVLAPLDDAALRRPVRDAVNNGIPVVIIDSGLKSEDYVSFVATDNYIGPEIEVVSANQYGGATTESAYAASENLLAPLRRPDGTLTIDGIFCPNESTAFAMLRALQDSGLAGKVKYVGFDSSERLVQGLANGEIHGLVRRKI
jgi:ribose transport system substrate-binding protein